MGRSTTGTLVAAVIAMLAVVSGCASRANSPHHHPVRAGQGVATAPRRLPVVPAKLILELNRNRGGALIQLAPAGVRVPVSEAAALAAVRRDGPRWGKVTSASLVTMGLPGTRRSLDTPAKVWMFGIAHPMNVEGSGGPTPTSGHRAPYRPPKATYAAQFVNATTGKWFEASAR